MGLYDNYRLQNSQQVYKYAGAPVQEMAKVGAALQDEYSRNRDAYDALSASMDSAPVLEQDKALFRERMGQYREGINKASKAGNYEDMGTSLRQLSRKFAQDYNPFLANAQAVAEEDKALAQRISKKEITAHDAERIKRARSAYGGLQLDAEGRYTNTYKARDVASYVDVNKKVADILKGMKPEKLTKSGLGGVISVDGGRYVVKTEKGIEEISPERVREAVNLATSDSMVKAYMEQDAQLDYAHLKNLNYEDLSGPDFIVQQGKGKDGKPMNIDTLKGAAKKYAELNGIPYVEAYKTLASHQAYQKRLKDLSDSFITTNAIRNESNKTELGPETAGSQMARELATHEAKKKIDEEYDSKKAGEELIFESNTTSAPERSYGDIKTEVDNGRRRIDAINKQLNYGKLATLDRDNLIKERDALNASLQQNQSMLQGTAQSLTKDLPEVIPGARIYDKGEDPGAFGKGRPTKITRGLIEKAMVEGRIKSHNGATFIETDKGTVVINKENTFANTMKSITQNILGVLSTAGGPMGAGIPSGKSLGAINKIEDSKQYREQNRTLDGVSGAVNSFRDQITENSGLRQSTTMSLPIKEGHQKQLSDFYNSSPSGFEVYKDGKLTDDVPASINVSRLSTEQAANRNNFISVEAKDKDGKKLEGDYKVVLKGNSNLNQQLVRSNKTTAGLKDMTLNNPVFQQLNTAELRSQVKLPKPVKIGEHQVHGFVKEKSPMGAIAVYFLDAKGRKLADKQGEFYVDNPMEAINLVTRK